jgi:hypothetical protein
MSVRSTTARPRSRNSGGTPKRSHHATGRWRSGRISHAISNRGMVLDVMERFGEAIT